MYAKDCPPQSTQTYSSNGINISFLQGYSNSIISIINNLFVPILFAVAFLVFLWGVYKYFILGADNEEERKKGRNFAFWAIIGFAVILSVWGLVAVVSGTFGLQPGGTAPSYPLL